MSCTAFFSHYYRVYSPVAFGKKWDKTGALIREYVPELKDVPEKYIYEPWKMSKLDQKQAKVSIGGEGDGSYPKPLFDAQEQAKIALDGMRNSYNAHIMGDDKRVFNGTARDAIEGSNGAADVGQSPGKKRKTEQGSIEKFTRGKKPKPAPIEEDAEHEQDN